MTINQILEFISYGSLFEATILVSGCVLASMYLVIKLFEMVYEWTARWRKPAFALSRTIQGRRDPVDNIIEFEAGLINATHVRTLDDAEEAVRIIQRLSASADGAADTKQRAHEVLVDLLHVLRSHDSWEAVGQIADTFALVITGVQTTNSGGEEQESRDITPGQQDKT